jgi:hypothetical protein
MSPERKALIDIIKAWESLPGGTNYSAQRILSWLVDDMQPAIANARKVLNESVSKKVI